MEKIELDFGRTLSDRNSVYYECVSDNDLSGDYYRASEVSALLADVRALVGICKLLIDSAEDSYSNCDCYEIVQLLKYARATEATIAAVERHLEEG